MTAPNFEENIRLGNLALRASQEGRIGLEVSVLKQMQARYSANAKLSQLHQRHGKKILIGSVLWILLNIALVTNEFVKLQESAQYDNLRKYTENSAQNIGVHAMLSLIPLAFIFIRKVIAKGASEYEMTINKLKTEGKI